MGVGDLKAKVNPIGGKLEPGVKKLDSIVGSTYGKPELAAGRKARSNSRGFGGPRG